MHKSAASSNVIYFFGHVKAALMRIREELFGISAILASRA
jgi:hypothetical protein